MGRSFESQAAVEVLRKRITDLEKLSMDLWWFIENVNQDTPDRTDRFFDLRAQYRVVIQGSKKPGT